MDTMKFEYPAEAEAFRDDLRSWLDANLPPDVPGSDLRLQMGANLEGGRRWAQKLYDAGYACVAWPKEYGGRDASAIEQMVFEEEMHRARAPRHLNQLGIGEIGPAILAWGTPEQKSELLPKMLSGEHMWCQGFSEPGAGSDLASLGLRAVLDGDEFVLNGQKIWNSGGQHADYCELLVRTNPEVEKHQGISCLLVNMHAPGIEVRPIRMLTGQAGFNEIFFTDARVPTTALLGPINDGWKVAHTTLAHERGVVINSHLGIRQDILDLMDLAKATSYGGRTAAEHDVIRHRLVDLYVRGEIMGFMAERVTSMQLSGRNPGIETALGRFLWQDLTQEIPETEGAILGPEGDLGKVGHARASVRTSSIAGGTREIHINNLAYRGLGLPKSY